MVFINSQKFACESCIKGHRSSSCTHTDRPLYEIKKKGRPVSQCDRCRQLRDTKRVHSKCTCSDGPATKARDASVKAFGTKQKRYIPILPSLPNGLQDAFKPTDAAPASPANPRQQVASLLNPCQCGDVWDCHCGPNAASASPSTSGESGAMTPSTGNNGSASQAFSDRLETLARAAALFSTQDPTPTCRPASSAKRIASSSRGMERLSVVSPPKRPKVAKRPSPATPVSPSPPVDLPPLRFPDFPGVTTVVPPFSTFSTLAGSGCTCGLTCQCPDCLEHGNSTTITVEEEDEAPGCMNCVDQSLREIDQTGGSGLVIQSSVLDKFFADAARIPLPPVLGGKPVEIPKLCCGGSCGCGGACGCGGDCSGCCEEEKDASEDASTDLIPEAPAVRSCCG
ncbi:copper fist DNA binding domain-containing protein [Gloeopeniophorella convolvens]|nr:copper fist DNA binding domain-containing protein [Gloeopeniophorella convolvens]